MGWVRARGAKESLGKNQPQCLPLELPLFWIKILGRPKSLTHDAFAECHTFRQATVLTDLPYKNQLRDKIQS